MMRKLVFAAVILLGAFSAFGQTTGSGTLTATATVQGSLQLVFNTATAPALTGAGTSTATLPFGTIQAYGGTLATGVSRTVGTSDFTVSAPFNVYVWKANVTSSAYTLVASVADTTYTPTVGTTALTVAGAQITNAGTYDSNNALSLSLTVPFSSTTSSISKAITFTATAN